MRALRCRYGLGQSSERDRLSVPLLGVASRLLACTIIPGPLQPGRHVTHASQERGRDVGGGVTKGRKTDKREREREELKDV